MIRALFIDLLYLAGVAVASVGVWWIYPPASLITIGTGVVVLALVMARGEEQDTGK